MARDYKGNKYGKLLLISRVGGGGAGKGAIWLAQCDCGNMKEVVAKEVARGKIRSCGNCQTERRHIAPSRGPRKAAEQRWYSRYVRQAFREGKKWSLSYEDLRIMEQNKCSTCPTEGGKYSLRIALWNPEGEYAPGNVINLCPTCNEIRGKYNIASFLEYANIMVTTVRSRIADTQEST